MRKKTRIVSVGIGGKQGIANQDNVDALAGDTGDVYDISTLDASVFLDEMAPTTCKIVTCTTGTVYRSSWRPYLCPKQWNGGHICVINNEMAAKFLSWRPLMAAKTFVSQVNPMRLYSFALFLLIWPLVTREWKQAIDVNDRRVD